MKRLLVGVGLLALTHLRLYAQVIDCGNIGFEEGTFRGWERWSGGVGDSAQSVIYIAMQPGSEHLGTGIFGHTITSISDGYDPIIKEKIPVVAPGSQHSVRIGTSTIGSTADQLRTTLRVSADAPLLLYRFAVVLQNPNHKPYQQPAFSLLVRTQRGDTIPCGYYEAKASNQTAGFSRQGGLIYRNWTTSVLDLRAYVGQQLTIELTAHGCTDGGHFGYAYVDAQCLQATITPSSFCSRQDTTLRLSAPAGFDHYRWNTGDTTATITTVPQAGDRYWVKVKSRSTLRPDCSVELELPYLVDQVLIPSRQVVNVCTGESYQVGDSVYTRSGTYQTVIRRAAPLCDSVIVTELTVRPPVGATYSMTLCEGSSWVIGDSTYRPTGSYQTRIRRAPPLCDSIVTAHLLFLPVELDALSDRLVTAGDSVELRATLPPGVTAARYSWSPVAGLSCPSCATTWAKPSTTTQYTLLVQTNNPACQVSQDVTITVDPCGLAIPSAFSPNNDGLNDQFTLIVPTCLRQIKAVTLYNRWGEAVFHQQNLFPSTQRAGWDGTYKGESVSMGVYTYQIQVELLNGATNYYTGAVTLLR